MNIRMVLAAALVGGFATAAHADCNELVVQVDDMIAAEAAEMNEEVLAQIHDLRNQGAASCESGNDEAATESLEQAISLFSQ